MGHRYVSVCNWFIRPDMPEPAGHGNSFLNRIIRFSNRIRNIIPDKIPPPLCNQQVIKCLKTLGNGRVKIV